MNTRFGLLGLVAVVMLAGGLQAADPKIKNPTLYAGYEKGTSETVSPGGTFEPDPFEGDFQVIVDAVTGDDKTLKKWPGLEGYTQDVDSSINKGKLIPFGPQKAIEIKDPPKDLRIRARVQWRPNRDPKTEWKFIGDPFYTPYTSVPPKK
jgi:hypothetical protein